MIGMLVDTPLGAMALAEDRGALAHVDFAESLPEGCAPGASPLLRSAAQQLAAYFSGDLQTFDVPLRLEGTDFERRVWNALLSIPYGETRTYGQIAVLTGNGRAARAVGSANHRNPVSIIVPCHRVIGADGRLTGYGGGLWRKERLLRLERDCLARLR